MNLLQTDAYKLLHKDQYPDNTETIYSHLTPRGTNIPELKSVVVFGQQRFAQKLIQDFDLYFFNLDELQIDELLEDFSLTVRQLFNYDKYDTNHWKKLWEKGFLPLNIHSIEEGSVLPFRVPILTIYNTDKDFFWLTNYIETRILNNIWTPMSASTIAYSFKKMLKKFAEETDSEFTDIQIQASDFSLRGAEGMEAGEMFGMGHLTSFISTSNLQSITGLMKYYDWKPEYGNSIPSTEHSILMVNGRKNELKTIEDLLLKYPTGKISILIDTWDYFSALEEYLPKLKEKILSREGKVFIRPDSGVSFKVILAALNKLEELFGSTKTLEGYKKLNPKVGIIYGEGVSLKIAKKILNKIKENGYSSSNLTFGIGSKMYQALSRDTLGLAYKTSYAKINGAEKSVQKLSTEFKKSPKGLIFVDKNFKMIENVAWDKFNSINNILKPLIINGKIIRKETFEKIKERIWQK